MTSLQLGLIVAGVVLVLAVVAYNWVQERRVRRRIDAAFGRPDDGKPQGDAQSTLSGRVEPTLPQGKGATAVPENAARRTLDIASNRYTGGLVSYLDVVNAQQNLLNNEQELAVIQGQKLVTSVLLIKALGGGWDASSLSAVQVKSKLKDIVAR